MPAKSKAQLRWVNSKRGMKALGLREVEYMNMGSKGKKLPERVAKKKQKVNEDRLGKAMKKLSSSSHKKMAVKRKPVKKAKKGMKLHTYIATGGKPDAYNSANRKKKYYA